MNQITFFLNVKQNVFWHSCYAGSRLELDMFLFIDLFMEGSNSVFLEISNLEDTKPYNCMQLVWFHDNMEIILIDRHPKLW